LAQRACAAFASRLVAEALPTLLLRALQGFGGYDAIGLLNELDRVLIEFSEKLRAHGEQRLHRSGMGTTLVLVLFHGPWTLLASVGDSRAYLDMAEQLLPEPRALSVRSGDGILLCSDGLTDMLHDTTIGSLLSIHDDPANACSALIASANDAGGKDNITALVLDLLE